MSTHEVQEGECMISIAQVHNFFRWESIYYHAANKDLRTTRPDPTQLKQGDVVNIPDLDDREEICQTGQEHVFQLREPPQVYLNLKLEVSGSVLANSKFKLTYTEEGSEVVREGYTDLEGLLSEQIGVDVTEVKLEVWPGEDEEMEPYCWDLKLGDLDPPTEDSGLQDRLRNLGYDLGDEDGTIGELTEAAILDFQRVRGLPLTGELDAATRKALESL
jgi:hypothetical protein